MTKGENGNITEAMDEIKETIETFYKDLYKEKPVKMDTMKQILRFISKTVNDSVLLSQDFTLLELNKCLASFKTS